MPINLLADETKKPINLLADEGERKAHTMFGDLRVPTKDHPLFNREDIGEAIDSAVGAPGINVIGRGVAAAAKGIGGIAKTAMTNLEPHEAAAAKAAQEAAAAEKEAMPVKPGIVANPATQLEQIENDIGKHINIGSRHDVNISSGVAKNVQSIENYWSDAFKNLEGNLENAQFKMPEEAMANLKYDQDEIIKKLQAGANPKTVLKDIAKEKAANENKYFSELMTNAPTSKDVSAKDFLAKYRDFRDALGGLKQDLKSEYILSSEKKKIQEAITKGKETQNQIKETLNQGLGNFKPEFERINQGYAEQIFPLRKNPVVIAAKKGKLPKNVAEQLRTNESGMPLLREIVKRDPELLRNVVGQRYKINPSEIHNPDSLMREYLDEMPGFNKLISTKESLLKSTAARKDISLANKIMTEKKLAEITKGKKQAGKKIKNAALIGAAGITGSLGVPYGVNKILNLFKGD